MIDPVLISKNGARLMNSEAQRAFAEKLLPRAFLLTPNLAEAAELSGIAVRDADSMARAADALLSMGAANVLVKGGHLEGEALDLLATPGVKLRLFRAPRIDTKHTHGTGCTYSAAIAAELAKGASLEDAIHRAKRFITEAIRTSPGLGSGSGPVNHFAG